MHAFLQDDEGIKANRIDVKNKAKRIALTCDNSEKEISQVGAIII